MTAPKQPPKLEFPCLLGPDERGIPHGKAYRRVLRAGRDNGKGTAANLISAKSGRVLDALSGLERSAMYEALLDSTVLDLREQYPAYDADLLQEYLADENSRIPRSMVPTMDLVLTRIDEFEGNLSFEVVNCKYVKDLGNASVQRRIERDMVFCEKVRWKYTLFTEREQNHAETEAARLLCLVVGSGSNINKSRDKAFAAAAKVRSMADGRTYRELKRAVGRSLGIETDEVGFLIAVMALYGFISVDLSKRFDESSPFCLYS